MSASQSSPSESIIERLNADRLVCHTKASASGLLPPSKNGSLGCERAMTLILCPAPHAPLSTFITAATAHTRPLCRHLTRKESINRVATLVKHCALRESKQMQSEHPHNAELTGAL
ncbi:hypothetical protein ABVT39_000227 [Epinephelus coioides]